MSTKQPAKQSLDIKDILIRKCEAKLNLKRLELNRLLAKRKARGQGENQPAT